MHNVLNELSAKLDHLIQHAHVQQQQNDLIIELLHGRDKAVIDKLTNDVKLARTDLTRAVANAGK